MAGWRHQMNDKCTGIVHCHHEWTLNTASFSAVKLEIVINTWFNKAYLCTHTHTHTHTQHTHTKHTHTHTHTRAQSKAKQSTLIPRKILQYTLQIWGNCDRLMFIPIISKILWNKKLHHQIKSVYKKYSLKRLYISHNWKPTFTYQYLHGSNAVMMHTLSSKMNHSFVEWSIFKYSVMIYLVLGNP